MLWGNLVRQTSRFSQTSLSNTLRTTMEVRLEDFEDGKGLEIATKSFQSSETNPATAGDLPSLPQIRNGTFCYQVVRPEGVRVRANLYDTTSHNDYMFQQSELTEVDQIITYTDGTIMVRLADHTGWMTACRHGRTYLQSVPLHESLWCWLIDNFPRGITVRSHPLDAAELLPTEKVRAVRLWPLQKVYCNVRVVHPTTGVMFYRLQSSLSGPGGWVYDRTPRPEGDLVWLLHPDKVQTDLLRVYLTQQKVYPQSEPTLASTRRVGTSIAAGELVVAHTLRHSDQALHGPFVQLNDGTWLYEVCQGQRLLEAVQVEQGLWECRVVNSPTGLRLRHEPRDTEDTKPDAIFPNHCILQCNAKVTHPVTSFIYYRVRGTQGWLLGYCNDIASVQVLSYTHQVSENVTGWTADFCRGVASTVAGVSEEEYYSYSKVLQFSTSNQERLHVFLSTQTVGRGLVQVDGTGPTPDSVCRRHCSPSELRVLMEGGTLQADSVDVVEEKKDDDDDDDPACLGMDREEELRHELMRLDKEIEGLQDRRQELLQQAIVFDHYRAQQAKEVVQAKKVASAQPLPPETPKPKRKEPEVLSEDDDDDDEDSCSSIDSESMTSHEEGPGIIGELLNNVRVRVVPSASTGGLHTDSKESTLRSDSYHSQPRADMSSKSFDVDYSSRRGVMLSPGESHHRRTTPFTSPRSERSVRSTRSASDTASRMSMRATYHCGECDAVFHGKYSRDIHCREAHGLFCTQCEKIFSNQYDLDDHLRRERHW